MLIVRTPFRISFFGGGTDFEDYFCKYGGSVISTTINKYSFVTLRHFPEFYEYRNQLTYSKIERFNFPDEVEHPLVREVLKYLPIDRIQISYDADLPAGSGLGSSSSFAVGLIQGIHAMKNCYPDKMELAKEAIYLERVLCNEAGGVQDQLAASFGGFNRYDFSSSGYSVKAIDISDEAKRELNDNLLLVFTGFTRKSWEISEKQRDNIPESLNVLHTMKTVTDEACTLIKKDRVDDFGKLLDYTWTLKKKLSGEISNTDIDMIYETAIKNGALGGKLLGAGKGGFMLLYAPKECHNKIKESLKDLLFVPFSFENTGTNIIYSAHES